MFKEFSQDGLSFSYPEDWTLEREDTTAGWTVTLQSPGTAFAVVSLDSDLERTTEEVALAALETLKQDYPKLEATAAVDTVAGELAIGHDIEFITLDATITCWTRCFYGMAGVVLVLCQVSGMDEADYEPALRAICASMRSEE
jgi:hypothetical protein